MDYGLCDGCGAQAALMNGLCYRCEQVIFPAEVSNGDESSSLDSETTGAEDEEATKEHSGGTGTG
jgi:hypothetical protein